MVGNTGLPAIVLRHAAMKPTATPGMNASGSTPPITGICETSVITSRYVKNSVRNASGFLRNSQIPCRNHT
jgi:hypothetical protein